MFVDGLRLVDRFVHGFLHRFMYGLVNVRVAVCMTVIGSDMRFGRGSGRSGSSCSSGSVFGWRGISTNYTAIQKRIAINSINFCDGDGSSNNRLLATQILQNVVLQVEDRASSISAEI